MLEKAVVDLHRDYVDRRSLQPRQALVTRVADRVVRKQDVKKPGFVVIPDTRTLLRTKDKTEKFQYNLMCALEAYLKRHEPHLLRPQRFLALKGKEAEKEYRKSKRRVRDIYNIGGQNRGGLYFHYDYLRQIYVSLAYGMNRNVRGGTLIFFDALRMCEEQNCRLDEVMKFYRLALTGDFKKAIQPEEVHPRIDEFIVRAHPQYKIPLREIDQSRNPIIMFSNRVEDGLLHTATRTSRRSRKLGVAVRPISVTSITYVNPNIT